MTTRNGTGRGLPGEEHPNARLTEQTVRDIRQRYADGATCQQLAADFGVGYTTIQKVVRRTTWAHVDDATVIPDGDRRWSEAELEYLQRHADDSVAAQAKALKRSEASVTVARSRSRLRVRAG